MKVDSTRADVSECLTWKNRTAIIPVYLSPDTFQKYREVAFMVDNRIKECKIESIVKMFEQLDEDDRKRCLKILRSKI